LSAKTLMMFENKVLSNQRYLIFVYVFCRRKSCFYI